MQHPRLAAALLLAFAFVPVASACSALGTGEGDTAPRGEGTAAEEGAQEAGAQEEGAARDDAGTVLGTVSVDGAEYEITEVRNCLPLEQGGVEGELELQGRGVFGDETVQVDAYVETFGGIAMDSISWSGPEGVFGSQQEVALEVSGGQVTGSAVLSDALHGTETVSIEFTLPVPDDLIDCHV